MTLSINHTETAEVFKIVEVILKSSGVYLAIGEGFQELRQFQELSGYKCSVFDG